LESGILFKCNLISESNFKARKAAIQIATKSLPGNFQNDWRATFEDGLRFIPMINMAL